MDPDLLVAFVKYLAKEESIQGTIDEDGLLREYAVEFLHFVATVEATVQSMTAAGLISSLPDGQAGSKIQA